MPFDRGEHGLDRGPLLLELRAPLAHALLSGRNGFFERRNLGLERLLRSGGLVTGRARSGGGRPHGIDGRLRIGRLDPRALGDGTVDVVKRGGVRGRSGKNAGGNGCSKNGPLENTGDHHFASFTASPRSDSATSIRSGAAAPEAVFTASASMAASFSESSRQPSVVSMRARRPSSETSA